MHRFGRFDRTVAALETRCPELVPIERWQQTVTDGRAFLARWGEQAAVLGWRPADLFGSHNIPDTPAPNYRRLPRYEQTGAAALTASTAAPQAPSPSTADTPTHSLRPAPRPPPLVQKAKYPHHLLQCLAISVEADHFAPANKILAAPGGEGGVPIPASPIPSRVTPELCFDTRAGNQTNGAP